MEATWIVAAASALAFSLSFATFWIKLSSRITTSEQHAVQSLERMKTTELVANASLAETKVIAGMVHRLEVTTVADVARLTITTQTVAHELLAAEARLTKAIETLSRAVEQANGHLTSSTPG